MKKKNQNKKDISEGFYEQKSWGSEPVSLGWDLPSLKLKRFFSFVKENNLEKASLLEVGCGSGRILASIKKAFPQMKLTGVDLSSEQISLASKHEKITFLVGNGEDLPFKNSTFDVVICFDFLEHIPHPQKAIEEISRVLKPKGQTYLFIPTEGHGVYRLSQKLFGRHFKEETAGHIQQFTRKEVRKMVSKGQISVTKQTYSYHLLGSIMDFTLFTLLLNKKIAKAFWSGNKYYTNKKSKKSLASQILNLLMSLGNTVAFVESSLFSRLAVFSTAIHITGAKAPSKKR